ncbi:hypothetical protein HNR60_001225 [Rhodopseudomonas rhenobacensis]|uniref:Uncharacterized protein n=1 Tax=Rhodopseudomonas rhenobacensis TaxID=87461 RepID=A0A7W7Z1U3_9BRAD|nr:hypothetical protein [Rhodopseudomonas rhenobacensis]MBB5046480.1 hypothetical protein [Rhodopseudomonas rhenobacensis]
MTQQVQLQNRRDGSWLVGLLEAIEAVSSPAAQALPCNPALLAAAEEFLARPCAIDPRAPLASVIRQPAETVDADVVRSREVEFLHA